jgi:hypothetical protein
MTLKRSGTLESPGGAGGGMLYAPISSFGSLCSTPGYRHVRRSIRIRTSARSSCDEHNTPEYRGTRFEDRPICSKDRKW